MPPGKRELMTGEPLKSDVAVGHDLAPVAAPNFAP
jgi:hypothetical protein